MGEHTSGGDPTLAKPLRRPTFILAHPGDNAGCGHHRIMKPIALLSQAGVCAGRWEFGLLSDEALLALDPGTVVWQRQSEDGQVAAMRRYREVLPGARFVYELDDALSQVPDASWHSPYMPPGIDEKIAVAIRLCDVVSVSTRPLQRHMASVCDPGTRIVVVPNMMGRDEMAVAAEVRLRTPSEPRAEGRIRVGWGGGVGHAGDLALLRDAMALLRDRVDWIFLGMEPEVPEGVSSVFRGTATPQQYLMALAAMDVDLIVAPLERNVFNECKSNLRILEAGACGYPVVASPVEPYLTDAPPVEYARDTDEWVAAIVAHVDMGPEGRAERGRLLRAWVERHYLLEARAEERLQSWIDPRTRPFRPRLQPRPDQGPTTIVCDLALTPTLAAADLTGYRVASTIEDAAYRETGDVLWVRPGTRVTRDQLDRVCRTPYGANVAAVCVVGNDSGPLGFPLAGQFSGIAPTEADVLDGVFSAISRTVRVALPAGPVVLLRRAALDQVGAPSHGDDAHPELNLVEWAAGCAARGMVNVVNTGVYVTVPEQTVHAVAVAQRVAARISFRWGQVGGQDDSALAAIRQAAECEFHRRVYRFVPPDDRGNYGAWASLLDTLGPTRMQAMVQWVRARSAARIQVVRYGPTTRLPPWEARRMEPSGVAGSTHAALFIPEDGQMAPHAAGAMVEAMEAHPGACVIYADHDHLDQDVHRCHPDFKTSFDHHLLLGRDYVTQCLLLGDRAMELMPTEDEEPVWECRLYATVLRVVERYGRSAVAHVDRVLAHIRMPVPVVQAALGARRAEIAQRHAQAAGIQARVRAHPAGAGLGEVSYRADQAGQPLVTVVIPTKNKLEMLGPCLQTVLRMTTYPSLEVVVVDNGSDRPDMLAYLAAIDDPRVRVVRWDHPYNWSALNNWAVREHARGEVVVLLNDDTRIMAPDWLDEMAGAAMSLDVGAVGARLVYPHGHIQHVGVYYDGGVNAHVHKGLPAGQPGYGGVCMLSHEATAVTGACLAIRRTLLERAGWLDEELAHNYNDVAVCLQLRRMGLVNVVATRAELQHVEGATRVTGATPEGLRILSEDGVAIARKYPDPEPYWNRNHLIVQHAGGFLVSGVHHELLNWNVRPWPWDPPDGAGAEAAGRRRTLVVGTVDSVAQDVRDGVAPHHLAAAGTEARIVVPRLDNLQPFDLRDPAAAARVLAALGVSEVLVTGLQGQPQALLGFLSRLGLPVTYRPVDAEAACPRRDLRRGAEPCGGGWRRGECQACLDEHGSPVGFVGSIAWQAEWIRFMSAAAGGHAPRVTIDLGELPTDEMRDAFQDVFAGEDAEVV